MPKIDLIMFDMDGTLTDSMPHHAACFGQVMNRRHGVPSDYASEIYTRTAGKPVDEQFDIVLKSLGKPKANDKDEMRDEFWDLVLARAPVLFPDVLPALEELRSQGCTMCVISGSAPFVVVEKMKLCGIDSFFKVMLGSDTSVPDMTKGPGHLGIIQRELKLTDEEFRRSAAIVGDAEYDMIVAKQAGLLAVGRSTPETEASLTRAGADYLIGSLDELAPILNGSCATHENCHPE